MRQLRMVNYVSLSRTSITRRTRSSTSEKTLSSYYVCKWHTPSSLTPSSLNARGNDPLNSDFSPRYLPTVVVEILPSRKTIPTSGKRIGHDNSTTTVNQRLYYLKKDALACVITPACYNVLRRTPGLIFWRLARWLRVHVTHAYLLNRSNLRSERGVCEDLTNVTTGVSIASG